MKFWKSALMVVGILFVAVCLTYVVMQTMYEIEHVVAVGIANMYSTAN